MPRTKEVKRYYFLEGVSIGESSPAATRVKVGGEWHWIPKSVIHTQRKIHTSVEQDEMVIDEWFAKEKGWA